MEFLIAVLFYLGLLSPDQVYTDADVQRLQDENNVRTEQYEIYTQADGTGGVRKTVWEHETY